MKRPILIGISAGAALLIAVLTFVYTQHRSRVKFDNLDRALKAVQTATQTGLNHASFQEKVSALALEYSLLEGKVSGKKERSLLRAYELALEAYQDSLKLWDLDFDPTTSAYRAGGVLKRDEVPAELLPRSFHERYGLDTSPGDGVSTDAGVQKIWQKADLLCAAVKLQRRD